MNFRNVISKTILPLSSVDRILRPGVRILMYHRVSNFEIYDQLTVSPDLFSKQMKFLSENYDIVSISEALSLIKNNTNLNAKIVITFDDGYLDNLINAIPILESYNIPATIFVTTDFCEQKMRHPRYSSSSERLHLDWDEVGELNLMPGITIGSHTVTHPYLSRLDDNTSNYEIQESKEILQSKINSDVNYFCYPSGDYGVRELEYIKQAGYTAAVTVAPGVNRKKTNKIELCRTEITQKDSVSVMKDKCHGTFDVLHNILHLKRRFKFKSAAYKN